MPDGVDDEACPQTIDVSHQTKENRASLLLRKAFVLILVAGCIVLHVAPLSTVATSILDNSSPGNNNNNNNNSLEQCETKRHYLPV